MQQAAKKTDQQHARLYGSDIDPDDTYGLNNNDFYAAQANQAGGGNTVTGNERWLDCSYGFWNHGRGWLWFSGSNWCWCDTMDL